MPNPRYVLDRLTLREQEIACECLRVRGWDEQMQYPEFKLGLLEAVEAILQRRGTGNREPRCTSGGTGAGLPAEAPAKAGA